jgi:hypothetical protein
MTEELLDRYGDAAQTSLPRPLPQDVLFELLRLHFRQRRAERDASWQGIRFDSTA